MPPVKVGHFQTLDLSAENKAIIQDQLYGDHIISDPVLNELLRSPSLSRLVGVRQHGISSLLNFTPPITRFEHSVGAFLLVRHVGGSLEEQVAALLHDVSHTAMSHVVDFALSEPGEESFHEVHKMRFVKTTQIPEILSKYGFEDLKPLDEELYPLVEMPTPHLCADRLDYGLRDAVGFGSLSLEEARRIIACLDVCPDATSPDRLIVLRDPEIALSLANGYMRCDRDVWGNPSHGSLYTRTAELMRSSIRSGGVREDDLWRLSDEQFWAEMRKVVDSKGQEAMDRLESEALPNGKDLPLPRGAKVRTIDPDVYDLSSGKAVPLSTLLPEYATERERYIVARRALYE
ncbi:uncharacterized protein GGS22DRAFT_176788 [Annulohypoxylon maeteangense]|uniref:uncharacterized protein n=1 Tax=Annulohypoxylon maeteangense TaxID=1927788 RepID=UPI00200837A2|nr:uncharacterized protein GGS22DRAFT_176788 [Annulohypoxylon maeteangense]KAI0879781.1 hypothetical protein GGS22DRAFT_176788 [Annulohypoxylon maeteangense]